MALCITIPFKKPEFSRMASLVGLASLPVVMRPDNVGDGNIKVFGKFMIAFIATRHGHDSTRSITGQYILTDPHRNLSSIKWIDGISTRKGTGYFFTSAMRSTSERLSTYFRYFSISSFCSDVVIFFTKSCSGASTIKSTPKMVSGRVVKTFMTSPRPSPGERGRG
jgi:hypothetical protein